MGCAASTTKGASSKGDSQGAACGSSSKQAQEDGEAKTPLPAPQSCAQHDEAERLQALRDLGIVCACAEQRFDSIVNLMKQIFHTDVALVSLIDSCDLKFKAIAGDFPSCAGRPGSFCDWILVPTVPTMLIVEDASQDVRFKNNTFVAGPPGIRFYAGAPLVGSQCGHRYGTLCLVDLKPRHFGSDQYAILANFAEMVVRELERDKAAQWQQQEQQRILAAEAAEQRLWLRALDCFSDAVCLYDCSQPNWPMLYANEAWVEQTGAAFGPELAASGFWGMFQVQAQTGSEEADDTTAAAAAAAAASAAEQGIRAAAAARQAFCAAVRRRDASASGGYSGDAQTAAAGDSLRIEFKPATGPAPLGHGVPEIVIPSFVDAGAAGTAQQVQQGQGQGAQHAATAMGSMAAPAYYFAVIQRPAGSKAGSQVAALQGAASAPPAFEPQQSSTLSNGTGGMVASGSLSPSGRLPGSGSLPASGLPASSSASPGRHKPLGLVTSSMDARRGRLSLESLRSQPGAPLTWTESGASVVSSASLNERPDFMEEVVLGPLVGQGAYGRCYRGTFHGSLVAVKVLECCLGSESQQGAAAAAILEASLSRSLQYPHIVQTYDWAPVSLAGGPDGEPRQRVYILQSFCDSGTLYDAIEQGRLRGSDGKPALQPILTTALEIAGALRYLHAYGVCHGDLNPSNVLLKSSTRDPRKWIARVSDFGLSRAAATGNSVRTNSLRTVTHMPPELLQEGTLSPATDAWSFGVLLYEMVAGRRAWQGVRPAMVVCKVSNGEVLEPPSDAPPELRGLIARCLQPDPASRPTFEQIWHDLQEQCKALRRVPSPAPR